MNPLVIAKNAAASAKADAPAREDAELDALKAKRVYGGGDAAAVAQPERAEAMSSKWKDMLFTEGSLFDMDDPWAQVRCVSFARRAHDVR